MSTQSRVAARLAERKRGYALFLTLPLVLAAALMFACSDDDPVRAEHEHTLASIAVTPANVTLKIGEEATITATGKCGCGDPVNPAYVWGTSDGAVVSVTEAGVIKAVGLGTASVNASSGGFSAAVTVTVQPVGSAIGPAGGNVVSSDGKVELAIPAGALPALTDVVIEPVAAAIFGGDPNYIAGTGYLLKPDGLQLQTRARLRIHYDPTNIPPGVFAEQLRLRERDRTQNQWREMQQQQLMTQMVQAEIDRFGVFAIVVQPVAGKMIGPAGGTLSSSDGNLELEIPAGALAVPTDVVIEAVDATAFGGDPRYIEGTGYQLKPDALQLQVRARLRIRYDPAHVPAGVFMEQLRLRERDRAQNQWRETQQHQLMTHMVQAQIERFGLYAIVIQPAVGTMIGPAGGTVTSADFNVELEIPAGALDVPTDVIIEPVDPALFAGDTTYVPGTGYEIDPSGLTLRVQARLRIHFDPGKLPAGVQHDRLRIRERDRQQNRWRDPAHCTLGQNEISTAVNAFGLFAITISPKPVPVPTTISISPQIVDFSVGDVIQMSAVVLDADGNVMAVPVTWSSSNTAVAVVDASGLVTGVAEGTASITASVGSLKASAPTNVSRRPASVTVVPATASLNVGGTVQLSAEVRDAAGNLITRSVTWQSSAASIATVSSGLVTGVAPGTATITARVQNVSGSAVVTVNPPVGTVTIAASGNEPLEVGLTRQLSATATDANGQPITVTFTWSSSNTAILTVDQTGLVKAVSRGTASIRAAVGSVYDEVEIKVVGETTVTGNNASVPLVFADGIGVTGLPVATDPGVRPTTAENIIVDVLPFWWSGNVADYGTYYLQQGPNTWRPEIVDGTGQGAYSASIYWGDNLTVRTWSASRPIRVEQALTETSMSLLGYNMTFLYGDGATEMYGTNGTTSSMSPLIYTTGATLIVERLDGPGGRVIGTAVNTA
ncbi:MAG: Ig-like domain-containing protein, partial [Gemmatimonadota bacterium]